MDGSGLMLLLVAILATVAFAGVGFLIFGRTIAEADRRKKRLQLVTGNGQQVVANTRKGQEQAKDRRKALTETLKQLEEKQKQSKVKVPLRVQIQQAGLDFSPRAFHIASGVFGFLVLVVFLLAAPNPLIAPLAAFAAGLGLPRWILGMLKKRRQNAFVNEFANSLEVIVRGVKAGLPLNECLQVISRESPEPVASEFRDVVQGLAMGVPVDEALDRLAQRMPVPEVQFFVIVLAIQSRTGGNLSEALGNLATVLRNRKLMKAKISALSMEAKASAAIIGSLPFGVMAIVSVTSPDYIMLLFTEDLGHKMLIFGGLWMALGILVMRSMINFKF